MRLLFFTDTHIRGTNPRSRLDDFYQTLKNKFYEIKDIIHNNNVDYVLHGGDWFDRPDISPSIVRDFAMIIKTFGVPIYTIAGNHDVYGHNPGTLSRTMLGLLEGTDIIKVINFNEPLYLVKDNIKVQVYGNSYSYDIDGENSRDYYLVKKDPSVDYCINIVHGMLLPKPFIEGIRYTLIDEILDTEADVTLVGHYHTGFGIKKIDEKFFINPGSLTRISSVKSELTRKPEVIMIDLDKNIDVWPIRLSSALSSEEVLNREHIEMAQMRAYKLNKFFQNVDAAGDFEHIKIDINTIIEEISKSQGLKDEVKLETIKRIENARQNFSDEGTEW